MKFFGAVVVVGLFIIIFQNCGTGFSVTDVNSPSTIQLGVSGTPTPTPTVVGLGVPVANFRLCLAANPDPTALGACLDRSPGATGIVYTPAVITNCQANGNTSELNLSICLSKNGKVIQDHREAKQSDINSCLTAVGSPQLTTCLQKRGILGRITQASLETCLTSDGAENIERCLRRTGLISKRASLFQSDAALCEKVEGTATLATCLQAAELLPVTVPQSVIDTCIANVTSAKVVRCLRLNYYVSKAVMQLHINECNANAGQAGLAACLDNQGLLPVDPLTQLATFQTEIDTCVTAVGLASVAKCLRNKNFLSPRIMQPHIASCFDAAGVNAYNCLVANFATVPPEVTDAALKTCFANNGNTATNAAKCLSTARLLPSAPSQENIAACARLAGVAPEATKPGQVGIAACLDRSGLLAAPLTQVNIDTCVTNVGLANVATCLHNQGIVPSYSRMIAVGGTLNGCATCHNANQMRGNLNTTSYASVLTKVVRGSSATSLLSMRMTSAAAPMPPAGLLPAANRAAVARWIDQGANNN